jgi:putative phosphonate metabolism protein
MTMHAHRYAVYLAPAQPYCGFGSQWLGRDADTGMPLALPAAMEPRPSRWVEAPAHYGLHATLKPPFRLAEGTDATLLDAVARAFAQDRKPFQVPLTLRALRGFVAWCLADEDEGARRMHALADACVRDFERFRAPATPAEVARRRPERLSARERQMLETWGYPYVFDTFTFHITLTGMLEAAEEAAALERLSSAAGPLLATPLQVDGISVFAQPGPGAPFVAARHYGFDGGTRDGAGAAYLPA